MVHPGNYALAQLHIVRCPDLVQALVNFRLLIDCLKTGVGSFGDFLEEMAHDKQRECTALVRTMLNVKKDQIKLQSAPVNYPPQDVTGELEEEEEDRPWDWIQQDVLSTGEVNGSIIRAYYRALSNEENGTTVWLLQQKTVLFEQNFFLQGNDARLSVRTRVRIDDLDVQSGHWQNAIIHTRLRLDTNQDIQQRFRLLMHPVQMNLSHPPELRDKSAREIFVEWARKQGHPEWAENVPSTFDTDSPIHTDEFYTRLADLARRVRRKDVAGRLLAIKLPLSATDFELICEAFEFTTHQREALRAWWKAAQIQPLGGSESNLPPVLVVQFTASVTAGQRDTEWGGQSISVGEESELQDLRQFLPEFLEAKKTTYNPLLVDHDQISALAQKLAQCCAEINAQSEQWATLAKMTDEFYETLPGLKS